MMNCLHWSLHIHPKSWKKSSFRERWLTSSTIGPLPPPGPHLDIGDVSFQKVDESTSNWTARDMWNFQWEKKKIKKVRMFFLKTF